MNDEKKIKNCDEISKLIKVFPKDINQAKDYLLWDIMFISFSFPFPSLIEWFSGGHYVYNPTLKRFFLFHFVFPFLLCGFRILHLFYLHFLSSNNPLRNSTNNKIPFFPFIFQKDFFGFILILCLYLLQTNFGISSFSHPDNALEVCGLLTPLHIVPEWYFLCQYAMLKAVPNKNAGFIILLTSIFIFLFISFHHHFDPLLRLVLYQKELFHKDISF